MLQHLITTARERGIRRLYLETGSQPEFQPAQQLYASAGFSVCGPFGDYKEDVYSVFMSLAL
jgi:putative acetyltransferase